MSELLLVIFIVFSVMVITVTCLVEFSPSVRDIKKYRLMDYYDHYQDIYEKPTNETTKTE